METISFEISHLGCYPLVVCYSLLLNIAITSKNGGFPFFVCLPEGIVDDFLALWYSMFYHENGIWIWRIAEYVMFSYVIILIFADT